MTCALCGEPIEWHQRWLEHIRGGSWVHTSCIELYQPSLITLDQRVRDGHAEYNRLRNAGLRREHMPPDVVSLERWYQRIKKADAARRKRQEAA